MCIWPAAAAMIGASGAWRQNKLCCPPWPPDRPGLSPAGRGLMTTTTMMIDDNDWWRRRWWWLMATTMMMIDDDWWRRWLMTMMIEYVDDDWWWRWWSLMTFIHSYMATDQLSGTWPWASPCYLYPPIYLCPTAFISLSLSLRLSLSFSFILAVVLICMFLCCE